MNTPREVLEPLLPEFEKQTGIHAEIAYTGEDPFGFAKEGKADLVISHYGHRGVEPFVSAGFGLWPRAVLANQMALLGPPSDPAGIRGLTDGAEAFRRIAARGQFIANDTPGAKYVEEILWKSAGAPAKDKWYVDLKLRNRQAVRAAAQRGAYTLWGVPPFLRLKRETGIKLEPLVLRDPLFPRIMMSIVVNDAKIPGAQVKAANALQDYLISPAVQSAIRAFRYSDLDQQVWWPAGRHNQARE